jgi:predicted glycoside hydrolase/deacetylase ChbG (UPF0249 family)
LKRLVVTADDVGLHPGMTAGAMRAHDQGIVTAVSVCGVGRDLAGAAAGIAARPRLDAGVHFVLVGERPASPPEKVPTLVRGDGSLWPGFRAFASRYALGRIAIRDVETELRAQLEAVLARGVRPIHANSHQHLHLLPKIFDVVASLAAEYRIPWVRVPSDRDLPRTAWRGWELRVLDRLGRRARRRLPAGLRAPRHTAGLFCAGHLDRERLRRVLAGAADSTELVCHPGSGDAALSRVYDWGYEWDRETTALCDPGAREALAGELTLAGFRDL